MKNLRLLCVIWLIYTELDRDRDRELYRDRDNWLTVYYAEPFTLQRDRELYRELYRYQWLTKPFCTFPGTVARTLAGTYAWIPVPVPVPFPLQCERFSIILVPVQFPVQFPLKFCVNEPLLQATFKSKH